MKRTIYVAAAVALLVTLMALAGCSGGSSTAQSGGSSTAQPVASSIAQVRITSSGFSPAIVPLRVGGTVTWVNGDNNSHTVTGQDFESGALNQGATYKHTFDTAGEYDYYCRYHPSETGKITVR